MNTEAMDDWASSYPQTKIKKLFLAFVTSLYALGIIMIGGSPLVLGSIYPSLVNYLFVIEWIIIFVLCWIGVQKGFINYARRTI